MYTVYAIIIIIDYIYIVWNISCKKIAQVRFPIIRHLKLIQFKRDSMLGGAASLLLTICPSPPSAKSHGFSQSKNLKLT
jgi:hypothetical protein